MTAHPVIKTAKNQDNWRIVIPTKRADSCMADRISATIIRASTRLVFATVGAILGLSVQT